MCAMPPSTRRAMCAPLRRRSRPRPRACPAAWCRRSFLAAARHAWASELKHPIAQSAMHLSLYQLPIEKVTPFAALHAAGKLITPNEDVTRTLYGATQEISSAPGLPAYEISNHARPGAECRHNL